MATANPKTPEKYRALVGQLGRLVPDCKTVDKKLWDFMRGLEDATKQNDATTVQLQAKAVAAETAKVRELLHHIEDMRAALAEIEEDEAFVVAENAKLVVLSKELTRWRSDQTLNLDYATKALDGAKTTLKELEGDFRAATRALETMDTLAGKFRDAVLARAKVVDLRLGVARKAANDRDRDAFKKAFGEAKAQGDALRREAATFLKDHAARVAAAVKDFGKDKLGDPLARSAARAAAAVEAEAVRIGLDLKKAEGMAPPPVDFRKAAKVLGIDKQAARVQKALDGARDDIADQLQQMSRDLGLGRSGRQLVEDLRRARVL